jgi:hypothetical protein
MEVVMQQVSLNDPMAKNVEEGASSLHTEIPRSRAMFSVSVTYAMC